MDRKTFAMVGGMRFCVENNDFCDTACPMYARCIGNGENVMQAAADALEEQAKTQDAMLEVIEGVKKRYVYFIIEVTEMRRPMPEEGRIAFIVHDERRYVPAIDRMTWGLVIYNRLLDSEEMQACGLISGPRD